MAGDWIKIQHATPDKPEVVTMSETLGIDQDAVVGKLIRLWIWADMNSIDGHALSVTDSFLNRLTFQPGFADAMRKVGWLEGEAGTLTVPNFDRHNGKTAKTRALSKNRKESSRSKRDNCHAWSVTKSGRERDQRREEKSIKERESARAGEADIPTLKEMTEEGAMRGIAAAIVQACWEHYEGKNLWLNKHGRLINWRQCLVTWNTNEQQRKHTNGNQKRVDRNAGTQNAGRADEYDLPNRI